MTRAAMIEVEEVAKRFGNGPDAVEAVCGVSFEVAEGEIFGLLGPNGAGKSTTVLMLATLLRPSSGAARVGGFDLLGEAPAIRRMIGVALQETGLDELQTGRQLLVLTGRLYGFGRGEAERRADELLELLGIVDAGDRKVKTYSGGMRRRIDLALGLVHRPRLMYLDEPTTGLDPASRRNVWEEIERLQADGVTILLTTQYLEEADRLADRVAIIDHGSLVAEGTPDELKRALGGDVIEIELSDHGGAEAAARALEGDVTVDGDRVRLAVADGPARVPEVVGRLQGQGIALEGLSLARPTLDDVFLDLTGRRLDPKEATKANGDAGGAGEDGSGPGQGAVAPGRDAGRGADNSTGDDSP